MTPGRDPALPLAWKALGALARPPWPSVLAALVLVGFLGLSLWRLYPYRDDVSPQASQGEDWLSYESNALSILHEGLAMPSVAESYRRPGGFLYNYFVAAVYAVLGERSGYVYVVQGASLGVSVLAFFLALRRYLSGPAGVGLLGLLALFFYLNAFRQFTRRLLSENLVIPLLALALWALISAREKRSLERLLAAAALLGLAVLTRPNLLVFALAATALVARYWEPGRRRSSALAFLACWLAVVSMLAVRDHAVTGTLGLDVWRYTGDYVHPPLDPERFSTPGAALRSLSGAASHYARRILFCAGLTRVLEPALTWRLHWLPLWAGFLVFVVQRARRPLAFWEALLLGYVACYLAPLIAVAQISNYGVRMVTPVMPVVLALAIAALDERLGWHDGPARTG